MSKTVMLKTARKVTKCGYTCHIYLPIEYEGKEVVGVILRDESKTN